MPAKKLAVVHWFPLEQYPPATNLLDYFAANTDWQIDAYTCANDRGLTPYQNPAVTIHRRRFPSRSLNRLRRWTAYLSFPLIVFFQLLKIRPDTLLYIEPHSALPAFLYCSLARRCRLFIHYHEYRDRDEYSQPGMRLVRFYHWIERRFLYRRAEWISQTNADRNRMFYEDLPDVNLDKLKVLPNYPPQAWTDGERARWKNCSDQPLRLVYVGAVSLRDTFIRPLIEWLRSGASVDHITLDIFSYNNDAETHQFLQASANDAIRFHARGVDYKEIPSLLVDYHVGLILYRANTRNYVYNASNKLFEYLALGLDVWYPPPMLGVKPYANADSWPRVLETDYERLSAVDMCRRRNRSEIPEAAEKYCCEQALRPLKEWMEAAPRE